MPISMLGRLLRGAIGSQEFAEYDFSGGLNVSDAPQEIGPNDLVGAYNGYISVGGGFASRYGMTSSATLGADASKAIGGGARFYQAIKAGVAVTPATVYDIVQVGSHLYRADNNTDLGSIGATQAMRTVRIQDPNDPNVGFAGLSDVTVVCTGTGGPYIWDGINLYTPAGWANAAGASWCAFVNGIVWFGGIKTAPNQIFGTGNGQSADASMETLPAYRNFVFSGPVNGLAAMGTGATAKLAIGRSNGVSVLSGTGITNFYLQDIPMNDGVTAGATFTSLPDTSVGWLGNQAFWVFDGSNPPRSISNKIKQYVLNDPYVGGYPISTRSASWAAVYNNRLHLGYATGAAQTTANAILVYDLVQQGWTVLQTTPAASSMWLHDAPSDAAPWAAMVGSATSNKIYNWDIAPTAGSAATDDGTAFLVSVQTKFHKLGTPGSTKALRRLYPEFFLTGTLPALVFVQTDYGISQGAQSFVSPTVTLNSQWDVFLWDAGFWAGTSSWFPVGSPTTRVDFDNVAGDAFSFGVQTTAAAAPWLLGGFTGVFHQRGRT